MEKFDVCIIGGGSGGILCALECAKNGLAVCIVEANPRIGKKLLASGNGRGNITNLAMDKSRYNCDFVANSLALFPPEKVIDYFASLGILTREEDGRIYPYCECASSLLNVFLNKIDQYRVTVKCDKKVVNIDKSDGEFDVECADEILRASNVVLACGSKASFGLSSYALAGKFGHKTTELVGCVGGLESDAIVGANGVRAKVECKLELGGQICRVEKGELLFKDGIISGVLAFVLSSLVARARRKDKNICARLFVDFAPDFSQQELESFLLANDDFQHCFDGVLHKAVAVNIIRNTIMDRSMLMTPFKAKNLAHTCKNFVAQIKGVVEQKACQVTCGGLDVSQWSDITMQSSLVDNLFAVGEMLDVDGECGGYNLNWAWVSALACAKAIVEKNKR